MADVGLVEKQVFTLERFTTLSGATLKNVRVGWESYGTLNADKSNAILVTHYFSGTSHAAGRYAASDPLPGYWDAVIGPGKPIDTTKYFVVSSDTLTNLNAYDPNVVTTGPASIDPDTGRPYGLTFPVVQIGDFVNVQKALVESLGITRLKAVAGPSMGALQAYEWAATYPEMVERIIPVIGAAGGDPLSFFPMVRLALIAALALLSTVVTGQADAPVVGTSTRPDLAVLEELARGGDPKAQVRVGQALQGIGSRPEAMEWYRQAAEQNELFAIYTVASMYASREEHEEAARWYRRGAELGDSALQENYARALLEGRGVEKNEREAVRWYTNAINQRSPYAYLPLAKLYAAGSGVERDPVEALALAEIAVHVLLEASDGRDWRVAERLRSELRSGLTRQQVSDAQKRVNERRPDLADIQARQTREFLSVLALLGAAAAALVGFGLLLWRLAGRTLRDRAAS